MAETTCWKCCSKNVIVKTDATTGATSHGAKIPPTTTTYSECQDCRNIMLACEVDNLPMSLICSDGGAYHIPEGGLNELPTTVSGKPLIYQCPKCKKGANIPKG